MAMNLPNAANMNPHMNEWLLEQQAERDRQIDGFLARGAEAKKVSTSSGYGICIGDLVITLTSAGDNEFYADALVKALAGGWN
jgi:hypothetical protein